MNELLRVYYDPAEIGPDGYPIAWHRVPEPGLVRAGDPSAIRIGLKDVIRDRDGHRCLRCHHPYEKGAGKWSPCDKECLHDGPSRERQVRGQWPTTVTEAEWRILTVHHLNGIKHDCRWWNLVSLCQRCHLAIQGTVVMERVYPLEHSEWFKPFAAGWYAHAYLGEELSREEVDERLDELLALERLA